MTRLPTQHTSLPSAVGEIKKSCLMMLHLPLDHVNYLEWNFKRCFQKIVKRQLCDNKIRDSILADCEEWQI